jgi:hypothetical protein
VENIVDAVQIMQPEKIREILGAMQVFINSEQFKEFWNHDAVYKKIAEVFSESMAKS